MRPIVLTILDGWGYSKQKHGNAILNARTPYVDLIQHNYPSLLLQASGKAVGMTWGEAGNSEVGHLTIGAGRVIFQYLSRINKAISDGGFYQNEVLLKAVNHAKDNGSILHLAGLITSGSVHAHISHLFALIDLAVRNNVNNLKIHLFADGKDSGLKEAGALLKKLDDYIAKSGTGKIATIIGRDYAMDRGKNWEYTKKAYDLLVRGEGEKVQNIYKKLEELYSSGVTDSKLPPLVADDDGLVKENDVIIFFNFREDSMRQITRSFIEKDFQIFPAEQFENLFVAAMTQYLDPVRSKTSAEGGSSANHALETGRTSNGTGLNVVFPIPQIKNGLAEVVSRNGKTQFHIAETEKYAHVTYFFNGFNNNPYAGETDLFIESLQDYIGNPEMRALDIAEKVEEHIKEGRYDFYLMNFASSDILSHSGNFQATIRGVETVDAAIKKIAEAVLEKEGVMIITADHGNAESMVYRSSGEKETKHEENPVPLYLVGKQFQRDRFDEEITESLSEIRGILADVAPTILELMGAEKPAEMTGESLLTLLR